MKYNDYRALLGGVPHTVTLAGYDVSTDTWLILDPSPYANTDYTRWPTPELMEKWGREFIAYPPRFAMTTLIPDTTCTLPSPTVISSGTPTVMQSSPTETSTPSQTAQPQTPQIPTGTSTP